MRVMLIVAFVLLAGCAAPAKKQYQSCSFEDAMSGRSCFDPDEAEIARHPLGSFDNPVKADGPAGQRAYLSRLICEGDKKAAHFSRGGSVGTGPYGFILDVYVVVCEPGVEHEVYIDMYHKGYVEELPAKGFVAIEPSSI